MDAVPVHLTAPLPNRELATSLVSRVTGLPQLAAHSIVLTTDATSTAVLRTAGIPAEDARPILAALWQHPARYVEPRPPVPVRLPTVEADNLRERQFVRDLGQRIHVIRHACRLTPTGVRNRTDIPTYLLRDIEAGDLWPSTLHLHRLAHAFAVPLPMLVDDKATPLRILRLLTGQIA
jgi:hypothetical protein